MLELIFGRQNLYAVLFVCLIRIRCYYKAAKQRILLISPDAILLLHDKNPSPYVAIHFTR